jgi:three-Cys-motif partner protein
MSVECNICTPEDRDRIGGICERVKAEGGLPVRCAHSRSRAKVDLWLYYLQIFSTAMRKKFLHRVYIDLFAGPGYCMDRDRGEIFEGSSLAAYKLKVPFTSYILVDIDKRATDSLAKAIQLASPERSRSAYVLNMDANTDIGRILSFVPVVESCISVAFLDPSGLDIHFDTIRRLSEYKRMDILIHFSVFDLNRNLERYRVSKSKADRFFGTPDWRNHEYDRVEFYRKQLESLGFIELENAIEPHAAITTDTNATIYYPLFASKHPLALKFWRNAKKARKPDLNRDLFE